MIPTGSGAFSPPTPTLGLFDGTALYEYEHPFEGFTRTDTIHNLAAARCNFGLLASALQFHAHLPRRFGLRADAVH